jgi:hypothetical protein
MNIDDRIVFVAGMPRSGSTWTYNVARRMIELSGKRPFPETIPPDQTSLIGMALSTPAEKGNVYCIKTHSALPLDRENVRIFCNYRDIRDVTLSYMRFMKTSFERATEIARGCMAITDYFLGHRSPSVFPINYNDIQSSPDALIGKMAGFLGVELTRPQIENIIATFSRDRIKSQKAEVIAFSGNMGDTSGLRELANKYMVIKHGDGNFKLYDSDTGFQSHHFTSDREGEWRDAFTEEQRKLLNDLVRDWLVRYGYPV